MAINGNRPPPGWYLESRPQEAVEPQSVRLIILLLCRAMAVDDGLVRYLSRLLLSQALKHAF